MLVQTVCVDEKSYGFSSLGLFLLESRVNSDNADTS